MSYPAPILNLNFTGAKQLHPAVAFSRASIGSYIDSSGLLRYARAGVPRFDHDPLNGICKGLLVEPPVTFLDTYSEQFDNAEWVKSCATITPNAAIAPDGKMTADKLVEDSSTGTHYLYRAFTVADGDVWTATEYVGAAERHCGRLAVGAANGGVVYVDFDLRSKTAVGNAGPYGNLVSCGIVELPNNRFCIYLSGSITNTTIVYVNIFLANQIYSLAYNGDGVSGLYHWGFKFSSGSWLSSYLPTTTSGVTRAADLASVDLTKLLDDSGNPLWTGAEGAIVVDFIGNFANSDSRYIFTNDNGSWTNRIDIYGNRNGLQVTVVNDGGAYNVIQNVQTSGTAKKISFSFDKNGVYFSVNGASIATTLISGVTGQQYARLGSDFASANQLGGTIRSLQLFNRRIADAYLPALSTL